MSLRVSRAAAQLLHRPNAADPADLVQRLLAVQAQDLRAARLALRARTAELTAADVDAALEDRELVVAWLGRGTLHLVTAEDYPWLLALSAPGRFAGNRRRLGQESVSPGDAERGVTVVEAALADEGPLTRTELAERIARHGIRTQGQATAHLLMLAALRGVALLGPPRGDGQAFVHARDWLGGPPATELDADARAVALAELARRYLAAHGPAAASDLAAWAGLPLRDTRAGLTAIASELVEVDDDLVDLAARDGTPDLIPARLLPAFDPYLLGWKDRSFAVSTQHRKRVHPGGGMLRATATVDGLVVGTWTMPGGDLTLDLFARLPADDVAGLQVEADDVARFLATSARPS